MGSVEMCWPVLRGAQKAAFVSPKSRLPLEVIMYNSRGADWRGIARYRELKRSYGPYPGQWNVSRGSYSTSASLGLHALRVPHQAATYGGPGPADCWAASLHGPRGLG